MAKPNDYKYTDVIFEVKGKIGIIKLNRPKSLNSFGGNLRVDLLTALRTLNEHPETIFTVVTGEGRFFSSGADVRAEAGRVEETFSSDAAKKVHYMGKLSGEMEMLRSLITHRKILVVALNGPAVGGGAAWFPAVADIVYASDTTYLQVPFSQLGLVPEYGSAVHFRQLIGPHRANDFFMFGRKLTVQELSDWGLVNRVFWEKGAEFHQAVVGLLEEQLEVNDGKSMVEAKRLQSKDLIDARLLAVYDAADALAERFVEGAPRERFLRQRDRLNAKSKKGSKL